MIDKLSTGDINSAYIYHCKDILTKILNTESELKNFIISNEVNTSGMTHIFGLVIKAYEFLCQKIKNEFYVSDHKTQSTEADDSITIDTEESPPGNDAIEPVKIELVSSGTASENPLTLATTEADLSNVQTSDIARLLHLTTTQGLQQQSGLSNLLQDFSPSEKAYLSSIKESHPPKRKKYDIHENRTPSGEIIKVS